jgi:hypothetical protein
MIFRLDDSRLSRTTEKNRGKRRQAVAIDREVLQVYLLAPSLGENTLLRMYQGAVRDTQCLMFSDGVTYDLPCLQLPGSNVVMSQQQAMVLVVTDSVDVCRTNLASVGYVRIHSSMKKSTFSALRSQQRLCLLLTINDES